MPLSNKVYAFSELSEQTFKRLPGLLADSLPDKFGNRLIDQWLERNNRTPQSFSPIERLCYIGSRGMGGLEFRPSIGAISTSTSEVQLADLVELANQALQEKVELDTQLHGSDDQNKQQVVEHC